MPRNRRLEIPGGVYHVIARGIDRQQIFLDDSDRAEFVRRLSKGVKETKTLCYGWALMPNHFHLIVRMGNRALSELMRGLQTGYAIYFNRRHKRYGHLFQNRYKSILCQEEVYLLELVRYVHLNPVRDGIVSDLSLLEKYPWTGYAALVGKEFREWQEVGAVLERFGNSNKRSVSNLIEFMKDGSTQGKRDDLSGGGLRRSVGGWSGVFTLKRNKEYWQGDERILGDGDFVSLVLKTAKEEFSRRERLRRGGWDIDRLVAHVCAQTGVRPEDLTRKGRANRIARARALVAFWGRREIGLSGVELSRILGCSCSGVSYLEKQGEDLVKGKSLF